MPRPEPPLAVGVPPGDSYEPLPVDRSVPFHRSLYSRDPDDYEPLGHFLQRQNESERCLTKACGDYSAVRKAIIDGELRDNNDGCGCFVLDYHGVSYYIVVGFHYDGFRIAVTGWPMLRERTRALDSGRWSTAELDDIEAFNDDHFNNE